MLGHDKKICPEKPLTSESQNIIADVPGAVVNPRYGFSYLDCIRNFMWINQGMQFMYKCWSFCWKNVKGRSEFRHLHSL